MPVKKSANSKLKSSDKAFSEALDLWTIYGARYATNLEVYRALLQRKIDLRIKPLNKIPECVLREYPEVPFLRIRDLSGAETYLKNLSAADIEALIRHIEHVVKINCFYKTVVGSIDAFQKQIKEYEGE